MARFTQTIFLLGFLALVSCSTCYECTEDIVLLDGNNNPIDTTTNTEEFCTGDQDEVTAREEEGAYCRVK